MKTALICSMPRSGTVYHRYLISTYDGLLRGGTGLTPATPGKNFAHTIGEGHSLAICHAVFPGFREEYTGSRAVWDSLEFKLFGYDLGSKEIDANPDKYWPSKNRDLRIVYLVRDSLSQVHSYWRHCLNHKFECHRNAAALGEVEFANQIGIPGYIKQRFTWEAMSPKYLLRVTTLSYAYVFAAREAAFRELLTQLGHTPDEKCLKEAVRLTSRENLQAYERETWHSLVPDQLGDNPSHFHS